MIRIVTTNRLRNLMAWQAHAMALQEQCDEMSKIADQYRELLLQKIAKEIPPRAAAEPPARDIGAENRRRNAERMVQESQQSRRAVEEDIPSTFPGLWSLGPETPAEAKPATLFGSAPDDSYVGGGASASYGDSSSCSSGSTSDSSSSSSDCGSSSSSTSND